MLSKTPRLWSVIALVLSSSLITPSWGRANERVSEFNIPPQSLDSALLVFAEQADVQVSVSTVAIAGMKTQGVVGRFTPSAALGRLLSATGLKFSTVGERTYSVSLAADSKGTDDAVREAYDGSSETDGVMHLAQAPAEVIAPNPITAVPTPQDSATDSRGRSIIDEVLVTGTHIRGVAPVGSSLITIDRQEIEKSGYATVQDVLKTLPQNFGGGVGEDTFSDSSAQNFNRGTAINLRGLGVDSTLVLVNGRRQPASGVNGAFVDIASIAASAVERIEVLTDGASAIYGSDAVAGVVNFILRNDYEGAETSLRFGTLDGDANETQASQLLGTSWSGGNAMLGYQYYERERLEFSKRKYTANEDFRQFGGTDFRGFTSNPGNILNPLTLQPAFAIPAGQDGTDLEPAELLSGVVNFSTLAEQNDLLPRQEMNTAFLSASQDLGKLFSLFAEGRYGSRDTSYRQSGAPVNVTVPASNPFFVDPFGGRPTVTVAYNFLDDLGPITGDGDTETYNTTFGATLEFPGAWRSTISGSYGEEKTESFLSNQVYFVGLAAAVSDTNPATAFNPFGDGSNSNPATIERIRASTLNRATADLLSANVIADGALFNLPSGPVKLAVGGDYREENVVSEGINTGLAPLRKDLGRFVSAAFAEISVPLLGSESRPSAQTLRLSLAGRYEDYSDFGSTFNPKAGLTWKPLEFLNLRGTWGESFKAPRLVELLETRATGSLALIFSIPDPQSQQPNGLSPVLLRLGNNAGLQEETATVWTAGFDLDFAASEGFGLSMTYFDIDYQDRVAMGGPPGNPFGVLQQESLWADIIIRNPSREQIDAICRDPLFFGSVATCLASQPAAIADLRLRNLAAVSVQGVDLTARQVLATGSGDFSFGLNGAYVLDHKKAVSSTSPVVDLVDTVGNIPRVRLRAEMSWSRGRLEVTGFVNHTGSYDDPISEPDRTVDSWTTLDLNVSYRPDFGLDWLSDVRLALSAVNALDEEPPFVNVRAFGYDTANADLYGRIVSISATKEW